MAPRLNFKKSRKGCQRCKIRKVKCDETQPVCLACKRHKVSCVYEDPNVGQSQTNEPVRCTIASPDGAMALSKSPSTKLSGPASSYETEDIGYLDPEQRRVVEMRLLHHYLTVVAATIPSAYEAHLRDLWSKHAILCAFEFPFLMNAILAIAALHVAVEAQQNSIASSNSDDMSTPYSRFGDFDYGKIHRIYLNMAVHDQRRALSDLSTSNADAVCLTSCILSIVSLRLIPDMDSSYTPPIQWVSMSNAIRYVVHATKPLLSDSAIMQAILKSNEPNFYDVAAIFNPNFIEAFQAILDFPGGPEDQKLDPNHAVSYRHALLHFGHVNHAIEIKESPGLICKRISSFPSMAGREFVTLLELRRPRALVILAHLMALCKYTDECWWVRGIAERDVLGIQGILPQEWQWAMKWPVQMLRKLSETSLEK